MIQSLLRIQESMHARRRTSLLLPGWLALAGIEGCAPTTQSLVGTGARDERDVTDTALPLRADFCALIQPQQLHLALGSAAPELIGHLFEEALTETAGAPAGWVAQVGYGPGDSDPRAGAGWHFFDVAWLRQDGDNDEYVGKLPLPSEPGSYAYTFRFSGDGGTSWTNCDVNTSSDFSPSELGVLILTRP